MLNFNRKGIFTIAIILSAFMYIVSCRKEKIYRIEGRLLLSSSNPIPVTNYKVDFMQAGAASIPFPASVSSAYDSATTDQNGYFNCSFRPGKTMFMGISGTNDRPITLRGRPNANFPGFYCTSITGNNLGNIYLYKKIDTAIISATCSRAILPADTLILYFTTTAGRQEKIRSGISASAGSANIIIDTIFNLILIDFNFSQNQYGVDVYMLQKPSNGGYGTGFNASYATLVERGDERKKILYLLGS